METDKMTAMGFAAECYGAEESWLDKAIKSRDAYRERQALEAAAARGVDEYRRQHYSTINTEALRAAILGEPRFVKGQLVRYKNIGVRVWRTERPEGMDIRDYEPVKAHIDSEGRVIVEET